MAHAVPLEAAQIEMQGHPSGVLLRTIVIGLTAFLTVVDLFATQAILPTLTRAYQVTPVLPTPAAPLPPTSPAMSRAILSAVWSRLRSRITWVLPRISTSSQRSISLAPCWSIIKLRNPLR